MARYVLMRQAAAGAIGTPSRASTPEQIRPLPHVRVIDEAGDRFILVEAEPKVLDRHKRLLRGWTVTPEVVYPVPWDEDVAPFNARDSARTNGSGTPIKR
jgi:hypothetical protein